MKQSESLYGCGPLHSSISGYARFDAVAVARRKQFTCTDRVDRADRAECTSQAVRAVGSSCISHRVTHISRASRASRQCDCLSHSLCSERTSRRWIMSRSQTVVRMNTVHVIRETHTVFVQIKWFSCLSQFSSSALFSCPSRSLLSFA